MPSFDFALHNDSIYRQAKVILNNVFGSYDFKTDISNET